MGHWFFATENQPRRARRKTREIGRENIARRIPPGEAKTHARRKPQRLVIAGSTGRRHFFGAFANTHNRRTAAFALTEPAHDVYTSKKRNVYTRAKT
jgi:hypothetical protein